MLSEQKELLRGVGRTAAVIAVLMDEWKDPSSNYPLQ